MSGSISSQDAGSQNGSPDQKHSSEVESLDGQAAETVTDSVECPSCGRTFSGTYCPDCGEEVGASLTMGDVIGDAFREVSEIGVGLPATLVGFTVRPGEVLQEYLSGARRQYTSPGRYLTVAVLLFLGTMQGLIWLDFMKPLSDSAMMMGPGGFKKEVTQLTSSQWYALATVFLNAGILGLLFWRIFGEKLRRGAEALAIGVFLVAHASVLSVGVRVLLVPAVSLWRGAPVDPAVPTSIGSVIMVLYPGVAAYLGFGTDWGSAVKGILGSVWAYIETIATGGIAAFWYLFLSSPGFHEAYRTHLNELLPDGGADFVMVTLGLTTVIYLVPLFLHVAMEAYYRLR